MNNEEKNGNGSNRHDLPSCALITLLMWAPVCAAQQLQITSPTGGTVFNPGQSLSVSVVSPANLAFSAVGVVGQDPIGFSSIATSVPAQFTFTIPTDIQPGPYMLTADGTTSSGQNVQSDTILIDVERSDLPTSIAPLLRSVSFESQGEQVPLSILGTFSDGSILHITGSSNMAFASSSPGIASVDSYGNVTAVSMGTATVTCTYTVAGQAVQTVVTVTVPRPVLSAAPGSLSFGSQNLGTSSMPQQITLTNSSNAALSVISVRATGDFAETDNCASSSPLAPASTCAISVTFTPSAVGSRAGGLTIGNSFNIIPAKLSLTGTGVGQPGTTTTIASSANPTVYGQAATLSSTVTSLSGSGTPTGSITFDDGTSSVGSASLSNGQAALTLSSLGVGSHSLTAVYSGDANFLGSTSAPLSQVVNQASTAIALSSSSTPSNLNGSITLTARLSVVAPGAGTPTGTIAFQDGSNVLGTGSISSTGQATLSTNSLSVGSHSLLASYSGDANFQASSTTFSQQIAYGICVLYDQTRSVNGGATFPIKLYLCDVNGNDVSSSTIVLHATAVTNISGYSGPVESPGSANPDNDFRYDSTQGPSGGYIFNVNTTGLISGTYNLQFTAGADPTNHAVNFGVK